MGKRLNLDLNKIKKSYLEEYKTCDEIALELKCSMTTIIRRLNEMEIGIRHCGNGKGQRGWSNEVPKEVEELYLEGKNSYEIADKFKCTNQTIISILRNRGIEIKDSLFKKGFTPSHQLDLDEKEVIRLYSEDKFAPRRICKMFNCSEPVITRILNKNNIAKNNRKDYQRNNPNWFKKIEETKKRLIKEGKIVYKRKDIDLDKLKLLYIEKKLSPREIGEILGCSENPIRDRLKKMDIQMRSNSEANKGKINPHRLKLDEKEIVRLYCEEKKDIRSIAEILGCSGTAVSNRLKWNNIEPNKYEIDEETRKLMSERKKTLDKKRKSEGYIYYNEKVLPEEEICHKYNKLNKSPYEICKEYDCCVAKIYRILEKNNIEIKKYGFFNLGKESSRKGLNYEEFYGEERAKEIRKSSSITRNKEENLIKSRLANLGENNPMYGKTHTEDVRKIIGEASKKNWDNPEFREMIIPKIMKGLQITPNKPETMVINIINQYNLNFVYTGDGKRIVGGFCPDFVEKERKKIIEVNGDYWHNLKNVIEKDQRKYKKYDELGYETLIIWEKELKKPEQVATKILEFSK